MVARTRLNVMLNIWPVLFPWFPSKMKVSEITLRRSPHFLASTSATNNYVMTLKRMLLCSSILTTRKTDAQGVRVMTCAHSCWLPTCRCGNARRVITIASRRWGKTGRFLECHFEVYWQSCWGFLCSRNGRRNGRFSGSFSRWLGGRQLVGWLSSLSGVRFVDLPVRAIKYSWDMSIRLRFCWQIGRLFSDAFTNLWKATISYVMSVRPRGTTLLPLDGFSRNLISENFFENLSRKSRVNSNLIKITGSLREDPCTFMTMSRWILHRMKNVSDTFVEKIKTHILCSISCFPPKIVPFMR